MNLIWASVVILAESNNPRLISQDFLSRHGIVPASWEVEDLMILAPLARVRFNNGFELTVEETKIQFTCNKIDEIDWEQALTQAALAFMSTLPHVKYSDVGLNFRVNLGEAEEPVYGRWIKEHFLRTGPWLKIGKSCGATQLKLSYEIDDDPAVFNFTLSANVGVRDGETREFLIGEANFHKELTDVAQDQRIAYINTIGERRDQFAALIEALPELE